LNRFVRKFRPNLTHKIGPSGAAWTWTKTSPKDSRAFFDHFHRDKPAERLNCGLIKDQYNFSFIPKLAEKDSVGYQ
jgi:hypothetical protein